MGYDNNFAKIMRYDNNFAKKILRYDNNFAKKILRYDNMTSQSSPILRVLDLMVL